MGMQNIHFIPEKRKEKESIKGRWKKKSGNDAKSSCKSAKFTLITDIECGIMKKWECKISASSQKEEKRKDKKKGRKKKRGSGAK